MSRKDGSQREEDFGRSDSQKRSHNLRRANYELYRKGEDECAKRVGLTREEYLERWRRLLGRQDPSVYTVQFKGSDRSPDDSKKT
jgi:hypothetical protein